MATLGKDLTPSPSRPSLKRTKSVPKSAEPVRKSRRHPDNLEGLRLHYASSYLSIRRKLGSGSYGDVYSGTWRGERVAVKVELQKTKQLLSEHNLYKALNEKDAKSERSEARFLKTHGLFHFEYSHQMINAMVFARAGASLEAVIEDGSPFAKGLDALTVCCATTQLIDALRAVHDLGFIHRDITPRNILLKRPPIRRTSSSSSSDGCRGDGGARAYRRKLSGDLAEFDFRIDSDVVYLIDFGLAKAIPPSTTVDHHSECREPITNDVVGTPRYCSKRAHRRRTMCERDDLLSLIYVAVFVKQNALPWASRYRGEDRNKLIGLHKTRTRVKDLCASAGLPKGFCAFAEAVDRLQYGERPRYTRYIEAISRDMEELRLTDRSYRRHVADSRAHGECFSEMDGEGVEPLCCQWNRENEYDVLFGDPSGTPLSPSIDELEEMRMAEAMARVTVSPPSHKSPKRARPKAGKSKKVRSVIPGLRKTASRSPFREIVAPEPADFAVDIAVPSTTKPSKIVIDGVEEKKRGSLISKIGSKMKFGGGGAKDRRTAEVENVSDGLMGESPRKKRKLFV